MSLAALLTQQLDTELDASRRVIERVPESIFDWRPHDKSWTTKELATHVAVLVGWGGMILTTDGIDFQSEEMKKWAPPTADSVEDMLGILESSGSQAREALAGMSDEQLHEGDWVIEAIGQMSDVSLLGETLTERLEWNRGRIRVDDDGSTSEPWLWAAGDCVKGPDVVSAVATGHQVAASIEAMFAQQEAQA